MLTIGDRTRSEDLANVLSSLRFSAFQIFPQGEAERPRGPGDHSRIVRPQEILFPTHCERKIFQSILAYHIGERRAAALLSTDSFWSLGDRGGGAVPGAGGGQVDARRIDRTTTIG